MRLQILSGEETTRVCDPVSEYDLVLHWPPCFKFSLGCWNHLWVNFERPFRNRTRIPITARDYKDHHPIILGHHFDSSKQYVEVGAGLGEFIQRVALLKNGNIPPIVIDPADYALLEEMLRFTLKRLPEIVPKKEYDFHFYHTRVEELISRCETIQNHSLVRLYSVTLETAAKREELRGIADVVVDNLGARFYSTDWKKTTSALRRILKPDGTCLGAY